MEALGKLTLITAAYIPLKAWHTWVFLTLWGWFVTPFFGVPVPPFWPTAGAILMLALLIPDARRDDTEIAEAIIRGVMQPLVILCFGFLLSLLV